MPDASGIVLAPDPVDGVPVTAYKESRFGSAVPVPYDAAPPAGAPDAGPVNSGEPFGGPGQWFLELPTIEPYWVRYALAGHSVWVSASPAIGPPGVPGPVGYVFKGAFALGVTYAKNEVVLSGGGQWTSLQDGNTGHDPASSPPWWVLSLPGAAVGTTVLARTPVGAAVAVTSAAYVDAITNHVPGYNGNIALRLAGTINLGGGGGTPPAVGDLVTGTWQILDDTGAGILLGAWSWRAAIANELGITFLNARSQPFASTAARVYKLQMKTTKGTFTLIQAGVGSAGAFEMYSETA